MSQEMEAEGGLRPLASWTTHLLCLPARDSAPAGPEPQGAHPPHLLFLPSVFHSVVQGRLSFHFISFSRLACGPNVARHLLL